MGQHSNDQNSSTDDETVIDPDKHLQYVDEIIQKLQNEKTKANIPDLLDKLIDAQYLTFSMIDYTQRVIDQQSAQSATTHFNNFISHSNKHPEDLLITLLLSLLMISFAISASSMVNNKKAQQAYKNARRILSGLKNGRHAFVNIYFLLTPFIRAHYNIVNPIGIAAGIALAPALIAYNYFDTKRETMIQHNEQIIDSLVRHHEFNHTTDQNTLYAKPQTRGKLHNATMLGLSIFDGLTDGAYMFGAIVQTLGGYGGFAGLSAITGGGAAIALLSVIAVYTVMSMVSSIFIEYERQKKLQKSVDEAYITQLEYLNKSNDQALQDQKQDLTQLLKKKYKIAEPDDIEKTLKTRFEKKYGVAFGETASRTTLATRMEQFEKNMDTFIGFDTEHKTQIYFNQFLLRERHFKTAHPKLKNKKINQALLTELESNLNDKKNQLKSSKTSSKPLTPQFICTPGGFAAHQSNTDSAETSALSREVQAITHTINEINIILALKKQANIDKNPLQENKLRYKTYCTELIAAEKKLFKRWKQTNASATNRLTKIEEALRICNTKCNPLNYFKRKQLKKEQQDLFIHQAALHRVQSTQHNITTLIRIEQLETNPNTHDDDKKTLNEIKERLNLSTNASDTSLNDSDLDTKLAEIEEKNNVISKEPPSPFDFVKITKDFNDIHTAQINHLIQFAPRRPQNKGYFAAFWRRFRGFWSGFKNTNKITDCTIKSPIINSASYAAKKIIKGVVTPAVLAYSRYVANKEKCYIPKRRGSPRLFNGLHVEKERVDPGHNATLSPV